MDTDQDVVVVLEVVVPSDGGVDRALVKPLTKWERYNEQAVQRLLLGEFHPALYDGVPVAAKLRIPFVFDAEDDLTVGVPGGGLIPSDDEIGPVIRDMSPYLIFMPQPHLPTSLAGSRIEGTGSLRVTISEDGDVQSVDVTEKLHPDLDRAATAAAAEGRFSAEIKNGRRVSTTVRPPYAYDMFVR